MADLLYKFRSFDLKGYSLANLRLSQLWCSDKKSFNDPFEFEHEIERHPADVEALYEHWLKRYPQWQGQLAKWAVPFMVAEMLDDHLKNVGVCCFTSDPGNVQMWSYYADSHLGFCLGFDFPQHSAECSIRRTVIYKVNYPNECPRLNITTFLKLPIPLWDAAIPLLTSKHQNWQHEREWRYLHFTPNTMAKYDPKYLKEVIVGARTKSQDVKALEECCKEAGANPQFREALVVPRTYEMGLRDR